MGIDKYRYKLPEIEKIRKRQNNGQALVEFALILPLLLLLLVGVLEFGRAFQIKIVMENAAREGAYYYTYHKRDSQDNSVYADYYSMTQEIVINEASNRGITLTGEDITVECESEGSIVSPPTVCPTGSTIRVLVKNQFGLTVLGYTLLPFDMKSDARMYVP